MKELTAVSPVQRADFENVRIENAGRPMFHTMMDIPLRVTDLIRRAERLFSAQEVVSRLSANLIERTTYAALGEKVRRLGAGLTGARVRPGDRVATLMWNHATHVAAYYAIPTIGAVVHALNPRLSPDELAYIVSDAGDSALLIDEDLLPLWEEVEKRVKVPIVIVNGVGGERTGLDALLASAPMNWPDDLSGEHDPVSICYTSGTTGRAKGVVYSHRSIILHALAVSLPNQFCISGTDALLALTPMFHVNAWGIPFAAVMAGAKLLLTGRRISGRECLDFMIAEDATHAFGVPTFWSAVLSELEQHPHQWVLPAGIRFESGGASPPGGMRQRFDRFGVRLNSGWGMTETSPLGSYPWLKSEFLAATTGKKMALRSSNGLPLPFVEMRVVDERGEELPWDGIAKGELQVRGPWVARGYVGHPELLPAVTPDGWLKTGDISVIDPAGYMRLVDRFKDLIKSGGEWISSIQLEKSLEEHASVAEAAIIAVPDERWSERPLAIIVLRENCIATAEDLRAHLGARHPKWMVPDQVVFLPELPKTSLGKLDKASLRQRFVK